MCSRRAGSARASCSRDMRAPVVLCSATGRVSRRYHRMPSQCSRAKGTTTDVGQGESPRRVGLPQSRRARVHEAWRDGRGPRLRSEHDGRSPTPGLRGRPSRDDHAWPTFMLREPRQGGKAQRITGDVAKHRPVPGSGLIESPHRLFEPGQPRVTFHARLQISSVSIADASSSPAVAADRVVHIGFVFGRARGRTCHPSVP
jgi:hypothetical protein